MMLHLIAQTFRFSSSNLPRFTVVKNHLIPAPPVRPANCYIRYVQDMLLAKSQGKISMTRDEIDEKWKKMTPKQKQLHFDTSIQANYKKAYEEYKRKYLDPLSGMKNPYNLYFKEKSEEFKAKCTTPISAQVWAKFVGELSKNWKQLSPQQKKVYEGKIKQSHSKVGVGLEKYRIPEPLPINPQIIFRLENKDKPKPRLWGTLSKSQRAPYKVKAELNQQANNRALTEFVRLHNITLMELEQLLKPEKQDVLRLESDESKKSPRRKKSIGQTATDIKQQQSLEKKPE